ncbi:response regulator [Aquirufa sp.]|jgi:DNA-binding response OmpR family regulator|uniref:response regulator n=1 Tax=Aquirufa sp. TaxID=2676249 RepID=UPI0037C1B0B0
MPTKILIIEDNINIRENTAELLALSGYIVETATDGIEGVRLAKSILPDIVICDIMMPNLDGFGVLQVFSNHPELARIPFIFLTAKTDRADMRKGMEMGADDYLTKPFQEVELLKAIESRLKKQRPAVLPVTEVNHTDVVFAEEALEFLDFEQYKAEKKQQNLGKKALIYAEGDTPHRLYFLVKGKVKTYHTNREGKYFITSFVKPGEFFGFVDILENQPYRESAEALEEVQVISIPVREFTQKLNENIHIEIQFRKALTGYLLKNESILFSMAYQSLRKRVALALVELVKTYGDSQSSPISMRLSREDLASRVGTATESVIRTLSDFKKEGLIDVKGAEMTILKPDALANLKY